MKLKSPPPPLPRPAEPVEQPAQRTATLVELLARPTRAAPLPTEVVLGTLSTFAAGEQPGVIWPGGPADPQPALSLVALAEGDVGRAVALAFPAGTTQPLILGRVWSPAPEPLAAEADGEPVVIEARSSLTLRCGQASITLTADGQVLLRGAYVSSHATGTQRIKGAAVRIN